MRFLRYIFLFSIISTSDIAMAGDILVILSKDNPTSSLSRSQIKNLFLKKTRLWKNGQRVHPIDQTRNDITKKNFLISVLGMSRSAWELYWIRQKTTQGISPPVKVSEAETMAIAVGFSQGSIGFLDSEFLTHSNLDEFNIKIISRIQN